MNAKSTKTEEINKNGNNKRLADKERMTIF